MLSIRQSTLLLMLVLLPSLCPAAGDQRENIVRQQDELQRLRENIERGEKLLDSLKQAEIGVQKRMVEHDQQLSSDRKSIGRLGNQLEKIRSDIAQAEERLAESRELHERARRRYLGNLRQFYMTALRPVGPLTDRPEHELEMNRQVVYLAALADYESGAVSQASDYLSRSVENLEQLTGERQKVARLKKKKETSAARSQSRIEKDQEALAELHRKRTEQADRILMLRQAAEEMERIVARLEQQRQAREAQPERPELPSVFASLKGHLIPPIEGKVVTPFGTSVDPITNLKSFSPGLIIQTRPSREVRAAATGIVAYVGELRGYGNFVIIDHGDQYYTTYAGLDKVKAVKGKLISAGKAVAVADSEGRVRFELRRGREPLDPIDWITSGAY